jgi:hypothetical protein
MDILFNALYWYEQDEKRDNQYHYSLKIFGRTDNDASITVRVEGIKPFFYVRIPEEWTYYQAIQMVNIISYALGDALIDGLSFKLAKTASYVTNRRSCAVHPQGSNTYHATPGAQRYSYSILWLRLVRPIIFSY